MMGGGSKRAGGRTSSNVGDSEAGLSPTTIALSSSASSNNNTSQSSSSSSSSSSTPSQALKLFSAVFYGVASILVIFSNKAVMTRFHFDRFDFLATVQFLATSLVLTVLILARKIDVPPISWAICREILPVSLMFLGNVLCGLGSTRSLNIPMFTVLRRFSIFMTMMGEWYLLKSKPSTPIVASVMLMVGGSLIAAFYDLAFDMQGYSLVFLNNIFTALNGVYMKKASVSGKCSKMGVLFYNSLFSGMIMMSFFFLEHLYINGSLFPEDSYHDAHALMPTEERVGAQQVAIHALAVAASAGANAAVIQQPAERLLSTLSKVYAFPGWSDPLFLFMFFGAASMGSVLNYSIFLCTTVNSALTTAVVGATKNVATTYIGMFAFPDYAFSWINFLGINISIIGSLYYTYMILFKGASGFGAT